MDYLALTINCQLANKKPLQLKKILVGPTGLGFGSSFAVAHYGLATASAFCQLTEYASGVLDLAEAK